MRNNFITLLIVSSIFGSLFSQDIHQSQFYTSPLNLNPALTGNFYGDTRVAMNYRNQYFVDNLVKYLSFTASFDHRFYPKKWTQKGILSGGLILNYDQAGDSKLGLTNLGLSASYGYPINQSNIVSLGGLVGASSRRFGFNSLTWDEQWNGINFDPTRISGESLGNTSNFFMDLSAGLNYRWQKTRRTKLDLGVGLYHLNKPDQVFFSMNRTFVLQQRLSLYVLPSIKLTEKFDLLLHGMYQTQTPYSETVLGVYGKAYLTKQRGKEFALLLGIATRLSDALIPKIAAEYKNWYVGASYDINTSPFKVATNKRGGPEFSLIYTFVKARPLEQVKACPIF